MNTKISTLILIACVQFSPDSKASILNKLCQTTVDCSQGNTLVTREDTGKIYLDGAYTGLSTPNMLNLDDGQHIISVGTDEKRQYLRREVTYKDKPLAVNLNQNNLVKPKVWKALFVGVPTSQGTTELGKCSTSFSQTDLDDGFEFFKQNLKQHVEPFSYNTIKWQVDRRDLTEPAELTYNPKNQWFTLEPEQGLAHLTDIKPGEYDTIFFFWREQQRDCSFKSPYFGLAWLEPMSEETNKTGYVTVKFNPEEMGVKNKITEYLNNDPGVWTHEWLHVVIEQFYPERGINTPIAPTDKLILHSATAYGYQYPWIDWYHDLISGQVALGKGFAGIGPEALLNCSVAQSATNQCSQ